MSTPELIRAAHAFGHVEPDALLRKQHSLGTLPISLVEKFEAQFEVPVLHGYGLSDTTAFTCTLPAELPGKARQYWLSSRCYSRIGTIFANNVFAATISTNSMIIGTGFLPLKSGNLNQ